MNITEGDETELKAAVYQQPVTVAFSVEGDLQSYAGGVYTSSSCKKGAANVQQAALAVGYGTENGTDYWLLKLSFGTTWGDAGFMKIERGVDMCGIADCCSYPESVAEINMGTPAGIPNTARASYMTYMNQNQ